MEVDAVRRRDHPVAVAIASRRSRRDAVGRAFGDATANRGASSSARPPRTRRGCCEQRSCSQDVLSSNRGHITIIRQWRRERKPRRECRQAHEWRRCARTRSRPPASRRTRRLTPLGRRRGRMLIVVRPLVGSDERPPQASTHAPRIVTRECVPARWGAAHEDGEPASPGDDHGDRGSVLGWYSAWGG